MTLNFYKGEHLSGFFKRSTLLESGIIIRGDGVECLAKLSALVNDKLHNICYDGTLSWPMDVANLVFFIPLPRHVAINVIEFQLKQVVLLKK